MPNYEPVDVTDLKVGDRIVVDMLPTGPKIATVTEVEKVVIPPKTGNGSYESAMTKTIVDAITDTGSPRRMEETIVCKKTYQ